MVEVLQLNPLIGSEDVPVDSDLTITYDGNVTTGSGNLTISERSPLKVGGSAFVGKIGEIIITNGELSLAERQKVEGYLAWEWFGNNNPLPNSHPYKYQRPVI